MSGELNCRLCQSNAHLEEYQFGKSGKVKICISCYNNAILREQIRSKFARLFSELMSGDQEAREKIVSLARQYKLPEPEISV